MRWAFGVICLAWSVMVSTVNAEPLVVGVWPGKAPGEKKDLPAEADINKPTDHLVGGKKIIKLTNVSTPTLTVYRPAPDKDTRAAMIVCPGGGHHILAFDHEGTEVAEYLNTVGVTALVLKYRVPFRNPDKRWEAAVQDAQRAVSLARYKAGEWGIDAKRIGIMGFSAGGETAGLTAILSAQRQYSAVDAADEVSCRPDFAALIYPGGFTTKEKPWELRDYVKVDATTPPMFFAHSADDPVPVANSVQLFTELKKANVSAELHVYATGGHGYGIRKTGHPCNDWPQRMTEWMRDQRWLTSNSPAKSTAAAAKPATTSKPAKKNPAETKPTVAPTAANVAYGDHERQVVDFWKAPSDKPTPTVLFLHGGGWMAGDKSTVSRSLEIPKLLASGISVVSVQYRLIPQAIECKIDPPVKWPLEDAKRALQVVRSKAKEWNIDKQRIAASGGSAGACSSLWLALHDDMARADSTDPVERESTRLWGAVVNGAQTSLDPKQTREWMPNMGYGGHAFGFRSLNQQRANEFQRFFENREKVLNWIKEYSPIEHASSDDPPIVLLYNDTTTPVKGETQKDPTHSALLGLMLEEKLKPLGVKVALHYPAAPHPTHKNATSWLIEVLKRPQP